MNYTFIKDFHKSRKNKIGASDIPFLVPNPEIQIESLAAYTDSKGIRHACTALDLYNEKLNGKDYEYSFPADMGHYLEGKAIYEFISDNISKDIANEFLYGYTKHQNEQNMQSFRKNKKICINPEPYNNTLFKHNTEASNEYGVAHADILYDPYQIENDDIRNGLKKIKINGLIIDLSSPFIIEAKTARKYTVDARKKNKYKGYDLSLKTWQGLPLKVVFQVLYQMKLYNVDTAYIALIFDTSEKHYWQIKANKKHQNELVTLAHYMKKCIDTKTPPKQLLMNSKDIQKLYPEIKEDFREAINEELADIIKIAKIRKKAAQQENECKKKKEDCDERMSLHLKDTQMIKGIVNDSLQTIAKWQFRSGGKRIVGLTDIKERDDSKNIIRYLKNKDLIKLSKDSIKPTICIKSSELESE